MSLMSEAHHKLALRNQTGPDGGATTVSLLYALLAVAATVLVIYGAFYGGITALLLRSMFYSLVAAAGLLAIGLSARSRPGRIACYVLALVAIVPGPYLWYSYLDIIMRGAMSNPLDEVMFVALCVVTFTLVRRHLGWALLLIATFALLYAWFGYLIPGKYGHGGYDLARLTSTLFLSTEGFFGVPMGVAVEYIFLFTLFGTLLMKTGTGEVFVDVARGLTGRIQGGPGLSAALSSTLFGTINGSAVANVVTTGTFTIPLMKRVGYSAKTAGAIEAAASSAGQILPPVMGAAAFLMAEIVGVPYAQIALAALVPGLLYVLALMIAIRLEAGKLNLERDPAGGMAFLWLTLKTRGYLLLPLIGMIALLFMGTTPTRAAVYCIVVALVISPFRKETRPSLIDLVQVCRDTLTSVMPIVAAVAAAGVVIGVLNLTGVGLMLSSLIVEVGAGNVWAILLLTALASFILGMGLPTSAAYLLLAVLVAPALTRLGMPAISAHMFIFYYGPCLGHHPARGAGGLCGSQHFGCGCERDGGGVHPPRLRQAADPVPLRHHAGHPDDRFRTADHPGHHSCRNQHHGSEHILLRLACPAHDLGRTRANGSRVLARGLANAGRRCRSGHSGRAWLRPASPRGADGAYRHLDPGRCPLSLPRTDEPLTSWYCLSTPIPKSPTWCCRSAPVTHTAMCSGQPPSSPLRRPAPTSPRMRPRKSSLPCTSIWASRVR